jgi:uncharacterized membrane protein YdjX (TVP38/TMEM64 family)
VATLTALSGPDDTRAQLQSDTLDAIDRRQTLRRLAALAVLLAALFAGSIFGIGTPSADEVRDWGDSLGAAGPLLFVPLAAALSCVFVPGPVLAGAAGLLFGTVLGTPVALCSAVLAAVSALLIGRHVAGRHVARVLPRRVRRLDEFIERRGFLAVLYVRLLPGIPYTLVNYGAGLTSLRVRDMAAGTAVGALPRTFAYVALGGSLDDLDSPEAIVAIAMLVMFAALGIVLARRQVRAERSGRG